MLSRRKLSVVCHGTITLFITAVIDRSQTAEPVTTANARIGPAILDGASPFDRAFSFQKRRLVRPSARG
jgi:hypothetical protein